MGGGVSAVGGPQPTDLPYCPPPPPQGQTPEQNATWWQGVPEAEQAYYVQAQPAAIGGMDGLPAEVRHAANMSTLRADAAGGDSAAQGLLQRIERTQGGDPSDRLLLLGYEPAQGDTDAKAIVAISNPDTADNVAVFVPGTSSEVAGIGGDIDRMAALQAQAETVPGSGDTSTIVWLGYDAPDKLHNAVWGSYARDGAGDLREFTFGLRAAHQGPDARVTVIGHSYGSTVVGTADAMEGPGLAVDDIIVAGSPGMGYEDDSRRPGWGPFRIDSRYVDDVSDMHISGEHFWAAAAAWDPVTITEAHGPNPVRDSFGGQQIATGDISGHSDYWKPDSESLRNQGYIITGNYDQVSHS